MSPISFRVLPILCASFALSVSLSAQTPAPMPVRPAPLPRGVASVLPARPEMLNLIATPPLRETGGTLFENVVAMLSQRCEAVRSVNAGP